MKCELRIMVFALIALFIIHNSLFIIPVFAQAPDIGQSRLTPASPLYFLKAVKENWQLKRAPSAVSKMFLQLEFAGSRLQETRTLISQNQELMQATLERYMANLNSLPQSHQEKDELGLKIKAVLPIHLKVLETMYPDTSNPKAKMAIRSVLNRVIQRADLDPAARAPVCALFAQEATAAALNEVERLVLVDRSQQCL